MKLSYSDSLSSKPTLLFIHGLGLNKEFWSLTIERLSHNFRCIAIDLPGHGESRGALTDGSMSSYAQSVRTLIEDQKLSDVTLVGHSMGGQISIILALQMAGVVSKIVLVSSAGIETFAPEEIKQVKATTRTVYANPINDDLLQRIFFHSRPEVKTMLMHEHVVQQRDNFKQLSTLICSSVEGMLNEPVFAFLNKITQPVLCIYGQIDTAIPNRWIHPQMTIQTLMATINSPLPYAHTCIFPLSGHYLPVDQPEEFAQEIFKFV